MDSFTQILLGIATAEIVAGKQLKNKTIIYGTILGSLPDMDIAIGYFLDPVNAVAMHRGLSHSLLLFILISPILGKIISRLEQQKIQFIQATKLVFYCLTTHIFIDLFTSWGTQIFWPFQDRIALKTIFVIDPLYTIPLLISLILCFRKSDSDVRKKIVIKGIIISSMYLAASCALKIYALQKFEKALNSQSISYNDLIVKPTAMNTILWNGNVKTEHNYLIGDYSIFDSKPIEFYTIERNLELENQLANNPDFEKLKQLSEGWYTVSEIEGTLIFNDLRFGILKDKNSNPQFVFSYEFINVDGKLKAFEKIKEKRDGKALLKNIWTRIQGN